MYHSTNLIDQIPKAELHLHIEGTLEPELMFQIANRNNLKIKYQSISELKQAYQFNNLQDFLNIYYEGAQVLITNQDFFDLTWEYLKKAKQQNIIHTEIFFDPQTHTDRGISFDTVVEGIYSALTRGHQELNISSRLIMCILRHLDENSALKTLSSASKHLDKIIAIGLDSSENGNPPAKFKKTFQEAQKMGLLTVAHAGEEGPSTYIREAMEILKISRIDHGNHAIDDPDLCKKIIDQKIPLTMCPLSNQKLQVCPNLTKHPLKKMLDQNIIVTINSDDPAYFGGYLNENYHAIQNALKLNDNDIKTLARNSIIASFLSAEEKERYLKLIL